MSEHKLKTWPAYFEAIMRGEKTFEVRKNDRGFKVGDVLALQMFDPETGYIRDGAGDLATMKVNVTYVLNGGEFGVEPGYVVMGIGVRSVSEIRQVAENA